MTRSKADYVRSQRQTRDHTCHWPGCAEQVPPAMWGCKAHWFALPKALRDRVWAAYRPGQEVTMTPSDAYLDVADEVQRWIAEHGASVVPRTLSDELALTLIQPWGTLIMFHGKPIENRSWAPGAQLRPGSRLWIHAGKSAEAVDWVPDGAPCFTKKEALALPRGVLLGHVRFDGVTRDSDSEWFNGDVGWMLSDPIALPTPVPCNGALGLWRVPTDVLTAAKAQLARAA